MNITLIFADLADGGGGVGDGALRGGGDREPSHG